MNVARANKAGERARAFWETDKAAYEEAMDKDRIEQRRKRLAHLKNDKEDDTQEMDKNE